LAEIRAQERLEDALVQRTNLFVEIFMMQQPKVRSNVIFSRQQKFYSHNITVLCTLDCELTRHSTNINMRCTKAASERSTHLATEH
jgi:hypothetical protein